MYTFFFGLWLSVYVYYIDHTLFSFDPLISCVYKIFKKEMNSHIDSLLFLGNVSPKNLEGNLHHQLPKILLSPGGV